MGKNGGDFLCGAGDKFGAFQSLKIQNGSRDKMPTGRGKFRRDVGDLDEVPNEAAGASGKNQARAVVEGDFGFEINNRHATRRRGRWLVEELVKPGFIERQNEPREREDFAGLENHAVAIDRDNFGIQPDFLRGELRGDGLGERLDAAGGNPSAAGGKFFEVVSKERGTGGELVVEQHTAEKWLGEAGEEFLRKSTPKQKLTGGKIVCRSAGIEERTIQGEQNLRSQSREAEFVTERQGIARDGDDGIFQRAGESGEFAGMVNQSAGLEPAGLQRRNIHNLPNRAVGTEDDLKAMIEREAVAVRGALASANLRRGLEQKKIPTGAL